MGILKNLLEKKKGKKDVQGQLPKGQRGMRNRNRGFGPMPYDQQMMFMNGQANGHQIPHMNQYVNDPRLYMNQQAAFGGQQMPYMNQVQSFGGQQSPYISEQEAFGGQEQYANHQERFGDNQSPFVSQNGLFQVPVISEQEAYGSQQGPFMNQQAPIGGLGMPFVDQPSPWGNPTPVPNQYGWEQGQLQQPVNEFNPPSLHDFGSNGHGSNWDWRSHPQPYSPYEQSVPDSNWAMNQEVVQEGRWPDADPYMNQPFLQTGAFDQHQLPHHLAPYANPVAPYDQGAPFINPLQPNQQHPYPAPEQHPYVNPYQEATHPFYQENIPAYPVQAQGAGQYGALIGYPHSQPNGMYAPPQNSAGYQPFQGAPANNFPPSNPQMNPFANPLLFKDNDYKPNPFQQFQQPPYQPGAYQQSNNTQQKAPSGMATVINQFKSQNGSLDFNKMFGTAGQMVSAVNQVSGLVKGLGGLFKVGV